jgi:hypothetical protein
VELVRLYSKSYYVADLDPLNKCGDLAGPVAAVEGFA